MHVYELICIYIYVVRGVPKLERTRTPSQLLKFKSPNAVQVKEKN